MRKLLALLRLILIGNIKPKRNKAMASQADLDRLRGSVEKLLSGVSAVIARLDGLKARVTELEARPDDSADVVAAADAADKAAADLAAAVPAA